MGQVGDMIYGRFSKKAQTSSVAPTHDRPPIQGNIYGVAMTNNEAQVFKLTPQGVYTILYQFPAGVFFVGGLVRDTKGNLYGLSTVVTESGKNENYTDTIWKLAVN